MDVPPNTTESTEVANGGVSIRDGIGKTGCPLTMTFGTKKIRECKRKKEKEDGERKKHATSLNACWRQVHPVSRDHQPFRSPDSLANEE
jgi:hypothetical protein